MKKVILLADRNSKAWDFAEKIRYYIKNIKKVTLNLEEVSINHFRNGEIQMHIPENLRGKMFILFKILQKTLKNGGWNFY